MEQARAAIGELELPTGIRMGDTVVKNIKFRELAGPEEDVFASNMSAGKKLSTVMSSCTLSIGEVTDKAKISQFIDEMVVTDRWLYLIKIRNLSLGPDYKYISKCTSCEKEDNKIFNLDLIKIKNAPSAMNLFHEFDVPGNTRTLKVRMRVANGHVDHYIEKLSTSDNAATVALASRITEIDGKPADLVDIKNMTFKERSFLRNKIEEIEGDIDDVVESTCKFCGHVYEERLALDSVNFFSL